MEKDYEVKFVYLEEDDYEPEAYYMIVNAINEETAIEYCKKAHGNIQILGVRCMEDVREKLGMKL